jgi:anti-sigma B factor antagonist
MTNNLPSLLVALADHAAIVKVNGRANFTTSVTFKHLVAELRDRGFDHFILDLSQCVTMDSTFLGVLASTALKLADPTAPRPEPAPSSTLRLLNPTQKVVDLLDNLGVSELFKTVRCETNPFPVDNPFPVEFEAAAEQNRPSPEELSRTCLEAHQLLMDLNPRNIPKFKDVTRFLAEDLKKMTSERQPAHGHQEPPGEACATHSGSDT